MTTTLKSYDFVKSVTRDRSVKRGDTRYQKFSFPFDFTGGVAVFTVKKNKSDVSATWKQDFGVSDYTITSEGRTEMFLNIPGGASFPSALVPGKYYYDWQFTTAGGTVTTYLSGELHVTEDISD